MSSRRHRLISFFCAPRRNSDRYRQSQRGLHVEPLEKRMVLTAFYPLPSSEDGDPGSLRDAVQQANDTAGPHTIYLEAATYDLTLTGSSSSEDYNAYGDLDVRNDVTFIGAGANQTTIDASAIPGDRAFEFQVGFTCHMEGVTLRGGSTPGSAGGAIRNRGNLTVSDSVITGNESYFGGGIHSDVGSQVAVTNTMFTDNVGSFGGAVYSNADVNDGVGFTVIDSTFTGNVSANFGGAITVGQFGTALISGSTISDNDALIGGGGIYSQGNSVVDWHALTIVDSTITGNSVQVGGGAIQVAARHEVRIYDSTLSGNSASRGGAIENEGILLVEGSTLNSNVALDGDYADGEGGAIVALAGSQTTITNSTLSDNTGDSGGAIHNHDGAVSVASTTITQNEATGSGGGVAVQLGTFDFVNTIVAENTASTNPDGWNQPSATVFSGGHNLVGIVDGLLFTPAVGDLIGTATMPLDPQLGPLQANGGPTWTHALTPASPAVEAGDNVAAAALANDQRGAGFPRIVDVEGNSDIIVDIGAYELEAYNEAPVAVNDPYAVDEGGTLAVPAPGVLGNDTDPENDPLTAVLVGDVSDGELTLNSDGSFTYEPNAGFIGTDSFTYRADDGGDDSNVATVTIAVDSTNVPPVAEDDAFDVDEDDTLTVTAPGVLGNDSGSQEEPLTATLVTDVSNGTLTLNPDGSFTFEPNADFFGTDSFTYMVNDGLADSNVATVTIEVRAIVDAVIDIKPNSDCNRVRLRSNGFLRVALKSTQTVNGEPEDFDAAALGDLDTDLFRLGDAEGDSFVGARRSRIRDVDGDGDQDLLLDFSIRDIRRSGAFTAETVDALFTADFNADGNVDLEAHDSVDVRAGRGGGVAAILRQLFELFGWQ